MAFCKFVETPIVAHLFRSFQAITMVVNNNGVITVRTIPFLLCKYTNVNTLITVHGDAHTFRFIHDHVCNNLYVRIGFSSRDESTFVY